jgi:hypothetical protein
MPMPTTSARRDLLLLGAAWRRATALLPTTWFDRQARTRQHQSRHRQRLIAKAGASACPVTKRGLPRWQFEPRVTLVPQLAAALARPSWALLAYLETPHGALGGVTRGH